MNTLSILFITILFFILSKEVFTQGCCTAGTSTFGGVERSINKKGTLITGFGYYVNNLNDTYESTSLIDDPLKRSASVTLLNLEMEYGLSDRVSVLAVFNYAIRERTTTFRSPTDNSNQEITFKGQGIGDLILLGKYEVIKPNILEPLSFAVGGGAKLPTGSFDKENNGARLSIDMQPGTGSVDLITWAYFYKGFPPLALSFIANVFYRYAGVNLDGYKYGDELLISTAVEYGFTEYIAVSVFFKGRLADKDFFDNRFLPSTGGSYFDLLPALNYFEGDFVFRVFYQLPLHRNVEGIQLATSNILGTELRYTFDFNN